MKKDTAYIRSYKYPIKNNTYILANLRIIIFLIPIAIAILIIAILVITLQQLNNSAKNYSYVPNTSMEASFYSDSDSEKLLTVVSVKSPLPSGYMLNLEEYDGIMVDRLVTDDLKRMINDCKNAGLNLKVISGYVSTEEQNELYNNRVKKLINDGYSRENAETFAELTVPMGNHDDRQSGLSVTFSSSSGDFLNSDEYRWLMFNAHKYGFIQRYPKDTSDYTNMWFTPDLFRYVGTDNANQIKTLNMCLEQYVEYINSR